MINEQECEYCDNTGEIYVDHEIQTTCTCIYGVLRQIGNRYERNPMNTTLEERIDELEALTTRARDEGKQAWQTLSESRAYKEWCKLTDLKRDLEKELEVLKSAKQYGLVNK